VSNRPAELPAETPQQALSEVVQGSKPSRPAFLCAVAMLTEDPGLKVPAESARPAANPVADFGP
jgi:hypothetical protein